MHDAQADLGRPIRVVLFCGGPTLDPAVVRFVGMLDAHPEIAFVGGLCQTSGQTFRAVIRDRWRRRGIVALPLLLSEGVSAAARIVLHPRRQLDLRCKAAQVAKRIQFVPDLHAPAVFERVRSLRPDLGLIYGGPILKPQLFQIPRLGTLGIHHGKVPEYRGKKTTFWAVYNGEKTAGVTIQRVNAGIDRGEVVTTGEVLIGRKSAWQVTQELVDLGFELYVQAIVEMKRGTAQLVAQPAVRGKLYTDPTAFEIVRCWWRQFRKRLTIVSN